MAKGSRILIQHLEGISGDVFASHPDILRDLIRGQSGIYALYSGNRLHYVGLASNLMRRVKQHLRDRHRGKWDRFSVYMTRRADHIKELESLLIRIVQPSGNRTGGRLAGSRNLSRELNGRMKESDKARRAKLLGGQSLLGTADVSPSRGPSRGSSIRGFRSRASVPGGSITPCSAEMGRSATMEMSTSHRVWPRVLQPVTTLTGGASGASRKRVNGCPLGH